MIKSYDWEVLRDPSDAGKQLMRAKHVLGELRFILIISDWWTMIGLLVNIYFSFNENECFSLTKNDFAIRPTHVITKSAFLRIELNRVFRDA